MSYEKGDVVSYNGEYFQAQESHTITQDFFTENIKYWELIAPDSNAQEWLSHRVGEKLFTLEPFVQLNKQFGNVAEPSTKHFISHDVFSHIKYPDPAIFEDQNDGFMPYENYTAAVGDTIVTTHGMVIVEGNKQYPYENNSLAGVVSLRFVDYQQKVSSKTQSLIYLINSDSTLKPPMPVVDEDFGIKVALMGISVPSFKEDSTVMQPRQFSLDITGKEFMIMQAKTFPLINLLWLGCILMLLGSIMAVFYRVKRSK